MVFILCTYIPVVKIFCSKSPNNLMIIIGKREITALPIDKTSKNCYISDKRTMVIKYIKGNNCISVSLLKYIWILHLYGSHFCSQKVAFCKIGVLAVTDTFAAGPFGQWKRRQTT